tara:strand:- start:2553 stop:3206 length:654 start_codon:yes stop_codon:yes gene_type:complete
MHQNDKKQMAAEAALGYVDTRQVIGIGSGSTVEIFINLLDKIRSKIDACVSSSMKTTQLLDQNGFRVIELREAGTISIYIDGADEANKQKQLIKGGGGALTREKIVASSSEKFICIIDDSKYVSKLGKFPLPIEVIPMAQSKIALEMVKKGARPVLRENFLTDNKNIILDVHGMDINEPMVLEREINDLPGVVTNGLFSLRPADVLLISNGNEVNNI